MDVFIMGFDSGGGGGIGYSVGFMWEGCFEIKDEGFISFLSTWEVMDCE